MTRRLAGPLAFALLAIGALAPIARGQGFIVDRRHHVPIARSFEVREVSIDARVRDQVAEVQISQTFHNPGSFELESEFLFPLPEDGAIQNFVLMVDGKELTGRLLPKEEARKIFEEIVRTKRDPALLEYMGRGLFRTSVFPIPPGADRKVTMRYTQLCRRDRDVVEFTYPLATQKFTAKPIGRLAINAQLYSKEPIKSLYSPSHDAEIRRSGDHDASVKFEARNVVPSKDFRMIYTLAEGAIGATVLSYRPSEGDDGYFLLLASPDVRKADEKPQPKTVIFVLDRSGSMSGKKIEQARNALKFVLENLRDDDLFNIVVYDDRVETYKPELQRYSRESRSDAVRFVENIQPGGSTNIADALKSALGQVKEESRPSYVIFLTDGLPTAGEVRETAIAEDARKANSTHTRIFSFGVGFDVNARLLDRISGGNGGTSEYVTPDENIESHVSRFYAKMSSPALSGVTVEMSGTDLNRTYPRDIPDLFDGGQLVWVGRYKSSGNTTVKVSGKVGGERVSHEFPARLAGLERTRDYEFVEKLWAVRRVGFLIDQIDLNGQSKELTDELLSLSTKYGILTPYTSFLADERVPLHAFRENAAQTSLNLGALRDFDGASGVAQREAKGRYSTATRAEEAQVAAAADFDKLDSAGGVARAKSATPAKVGGSGLGGQAGRGVNPANAPRSSREAYARMRAPIVSGPAQGGKLSEARDNVRQVGNRAFFKKGDRWVDANVKPEAEAKAIVIEQFSPEYFALARGQSAELNQYLTFEEPVTVELDGKVYKIERPKAK